MKIIQILIFSIGIAVNTIFTVLAQNRTDLPLYQAEQKRKESTLNFISKSLNKHEGMQLNYDSLQKIMLQDSIKRYNLLQKPKTLQQGNRKSYRNR